MTKEILEKFRTYIDGLISQPEKDRRTVREIMEEYLLHEISSALEKQKEQVVKVLEEEKLLEVGVNPETLMWKQRINNHLDQAISKISSL